jgi:hypothetical protein
MDSPTTRPPAREVAVVRAVQALDRISSFLRRFSRRVAILAIAGLVGGAAIGVAVVREVPADNRLTVAVILGVVLALPPIVLGTFALAVRAIAQLPERLRESPDAVRAHAEDLGRRAREVADARSGGRLRTLVAVLRLVRTAGSSRDLVGSILPGAFLLSPARLLATVLAGVGALAEVVLGAIALGWLMLA